MARRRPLLPIFLIAGTSLIILSVLNPWLLVSATTPTGGDMGAHVYGPAFLRDTLLPQGRILGWSNDWFAGFPAFYFYFPLPSLTIVALDVLIPYGSAFKIVTVLGLIALPGAVYFHARALLLGRSVSLVASGAAAVFVFMESFSIYGGNIASTLAGEFSYSWSFALSLVYLGLLIKGVREDRRYLKWAALALAATALSHVLTTLVVVFASLFVLGWKRGLARTLLTWAWGFAIAAFWALPLIVRIGLSSDMAWTPLNGWDELFPVELWVLLPVAIPAAIWLLRRTSRVAPMIGATLLPVIYFPLPNLLPEVLPEVFTGERWKLWNGRLLPFWYFGVAFFAVIGLGAAAVWVSRRLPGRLPKYAATAFVITVFATAAGITADSAEAPEWAWAVVAASGVGVAAASVLLLPRELDTRRFLSAVAVVVVVLGATAGVTFVDGWARWNYEGYERKDPWPEYQALMMTLDEMPPGRVMWESNTELNKYGTPMSPMLIPYWTNGSHQSMEGLYFESSLTTPFHFINHSEMSSKPSNPVPGLKYHTFEMERGVEHMDIYGVSYYVSFTPEAAEKAENEVGLQRLATVEPFAVFALPATDLVVPASHLPAVYEVPDRSLLGPAAIDETGAPLPAFHDMALEWYEDIDDMDRWVVADGPTDWPRITSLDQRPDVSLQAPEGAVSDIEVDHHRIAFDTTAVGIPHLVKVSYFPNWTASGAEGPYRAAPSLMVVVPTNQHVEIEFANTWAETMGRTLSLVGVTALVVWVWVDRRRLNPPQGDDGS
ncbi:MAG: hypothetical protein ACRDVL_13310 [Acidimicrobiia bacterium]